MRIGIETKLATSSANPKKPMSNFYSKQGITTANRTDHLRNTDLNIKYIHSLQFYYILSKKQHYFPIVFFSSQPENLFTPRFYLAIKNDFNRNISVNEKRHTPNDGMRLKPMI